MPSPGHSLWQGEMPAKRGGEIVDGIFFWLDWRLLSRKGSLLRWHVEARYDVWAGCWQVRRSDPPGLGASSPTEAALRDLIGSRRRDAADGTGYDLAITTRKQMWTLASPLVASMIVNGRRVTRRWADRLRSRFATT